MISRLDAGRSAARGRRPAWSVSSALPSARVHVNAAGFLLDHCRTVSPQNRRNCFAENPARASHYTGAWCPGQAYA